MLVDLEVFYLGHLKNLYTIQYNTILIIRSVCHGEHASYFLTPCEPPVRAAWIPLGDTLCGYRTVVSVSSAL